MNASTTLLRRHFFGRLNLLARKLNAIERSSILNVIVKDLARAVIARSEGYGYDDAEGQAWRRAEWRIRWGVKEPAEIELALSHLRIVIEIGMQLAASGQEIGWPTGPDFWDAG